MAQPALGMIETKGLCALFEATDAALKAADVSFSGWEKIGSGYVTAFFRGARHCHRVEQSQRQLFGDPAR